MRTYPDPMDRRVLGCLLGLATCLFALDAGLSGQASGRLAGSRGDGSSFQGGLRYIPSLSLGAGLGRNLGLDAELSGHGWAGLRLGESLSSDCALKPYRAWLRFASPRFVARAGLQKLNFGSATLLRPLQWFDRIDPRDPLGLTDGVYGLLGRCYFRNNANLWAWGLIGNSSPRGWELYGSERWTPEFGGRAQLPVPRGEVAATCHRRTFRYEVSHVPPGPTETLAVAEDRLGLDGRWDVGIGVWVEAAVSHHHSSRVPLPWQEFATAGVDYTFGLGNGLSVVAEQLVLRGSETPLGAGGATAVSALLAAYPLGLLDNLQAIAYYDWTNGQLYRLAGWHRSYDAWSFHLLAFWNPAASGPLMPAGSPAPSGWGAQLLVTFNH